MHADIKSIVVVLLTMAGVTLGTALYNAPAAAEPALPALMPEALEIELALSAVPKKLRDGAAVFVLRRGGYAQARAGSNHYMCFVMRTVPRFDVQSTDTLIPICFDQEGTRTIAPLHFDVAKYREQGLQPEEMRQRIKAAFANGEYTAPNQTGISFMISPILNLPDGKGGIWNYPPHFMFYAPHLTNEEVDTVRDTSGGWLPWINNMGPHGMIIVPVGQAERDVIRQESQDLIQQVEQFLRSQ